MLSRFQKLKLDFAKYAYFLLKIGFNCSSQQDSESQDAKIMAVIMKMAPTPEINVSVSFNISEETANETTTSVKRMRVELTGDMDFKPSDHK